MNKIELNELLEKVSDEKSFLLFVDALRIDREAEVGVQKVEGIFNCDHGPDGWVNHSIEAFLEAAQSWAESTNVGASQGIEESNHWKRFATFLYCGKIYE